jgi:hypothetical protein
LEDREGSADELPGHAGHRVLARAVDVEHDGVVGVRLEHVGELAVHLLRARVRVRLLDRDDATVADDGARRAERGGHLGGWCA